MNIRRKAVKEGYRSGIEMDMSQFLSKHGVVHEYEPKDKKLNYVKPATNHKYLPDIVVAGIYFELKGRFTVADRKKMELVISQHPDLDIRVVLQNPKVKLSKASKTTYAEWCEKKKINWCTLEDMKAICLAVGK